MPVVQTAPRKAKRKRQTSRRRIRNLGVRSRRQLLVRGNRTTHVLVPIDEYEKYQQTLEAARLTAKLEDPKAKWIDFDDFAAEVATDVIAEVRKKAGLTQNQLAAKLKIPQSQISRIERNPDRTTVRTLKKIAKALGVDVRSLLGG